MEKDLTPQDSTYFFIGQLSDQSAQYEVQQYPLPRGFFLEVLLDGIAVWGSSREPFDKVKLDVREMLDTIMAIIVFKTKTPFLYQLETWVETKEVLAKKNVIGWILSPLKSRKSHPRRSKKNTPWKRAAAFCGKVTGNHLLALKDYRAAVMDSSSEDAFLFAYRSMEDICRAVTGCDEITSTDWAKMHRTLRTSKSLIDPLTDVAKMVRHGDKTHSVVTHAKAHRPSLLNIAHEVITKEISRTFPRL